jgi:PKD repeat protein
MPYASGCDSGQAPTGVLRNPDTDGTLDSAIHEVIEAATDPGTDGSGWYDSGGQEIGDKCTSPVVNAPAAIYGTPLGGSLSATTAFNQLIGGHTYYTQQMWGNNAPKTPPSTLRAGCVQRVGASPVFLAPAALQHVNVAVAFDGSKSYDLVAVISRYAWNYGDGSPVDTTHGAHGSHIYTKAGTYAVTLTVSDATGLTNATTETQTVKVGP